MSKIKLNKFRNVLEPYDYKNEGDDYENYYKEIFPYSEVPKVVFDHVQVPINTPEKIWITDTTFRDGQQASSPFTKLQIIKLYEYMHKLDNGSGVIRQTEFFLYNKKDREAAYECMEKGYDFPQVTSWIRANANDFKLVKDMGIKETGILMSCSDYHIYKKLKLTRKEAMNKYLSIAESAVSNGIIPRCHLEDITRADFFGFVVPLVKALMKLSKDSGVPIKIRACDTLGVGVPYSGAAFPRSVQKIIHGLIFYGDVPSECIEWHGHNDFYNAVTNSTTAWLYGASAINTTMLGIGERTGNCPLEAMIMEYMQVKGTQENMNIHVITEAKNYIEKEFNYDIPERMPFIGSNFNVTRAGIHADGILKDEEIYNAFDTEKLLGRPILVSVNQYSGTAGIAAWINTYYKLKGDDKIDKFDERIVPIKNWVDNEYRRGRNTVISNKELDDQAKKFVPEIIEKKAEKAS